MPPPDNGSCKISKSADIYFSRKSGTCGQTDRQTDVAPNYIDDVNRGEKPCEQEGTGGTPPASLTVFLPTFRLPYKTPASLILIIIYAVFSKTEGIGGWLVLFYRHCTRSGVYTKIYKCPQPY